jgi:hypothetical protein
VARRTFFNHVRSLGSPPSTTRARTAAVTTVAWNAHGIERLSCIRRRFTNVAPGLFCEPLWLEILWVRNIPQIQIQLLYILPPSNSFSSTRRTYPW